MLSFNCSLYVWGCWRRSLAFSFTTVLPTRLFKSVVISWIHKLSRFSIYSIASSRTYGCRFSTFPSSFMYGSANFIFLDVPDSWLNNTELGQEHYVCGEGTGIVHWDSWSHGSGRTAQSFLLIHFLGSSPLTVLERRTVLALEMLAWTWENFFFQS